jgi:hypothetical protein
VENTEIIKEAAAARKNHKKQKTHETTVLLV